MCETYDQHCIARLKAFTIKAQLVNFTCLGMQQGTLCILCQMIYTRPDSSLEPVF